MHEPGRIYIQEKWLFIALSGSVIAIMVAIYKEPMQKVFRTVPLGLNEWVWILVVSIAVVIAVEIIKMLNRRRIPQ